MAIDWRKLDWKNVVVPAATLIIGGVAVFATNGFGYLSKSRELDIRMVEISLSILSGEKENTDSEQARRFALTALEQYSGIDISDGDFKQWVEKGEVVFGPIPITSSGFGGGGGDDAFLNSLSGMISAPTLIPLKPLIAEEFDQRLLFQEMSRYATDDWYKYQLSKPATRETLIRLLGEDYSPPAQQTAPD